MKVKYLLPKVDEEVRSQLVTYARSQAVEHRLRLRSQIILDWMAGMTYKESSQANDVTEAVVAKWRKRFSESQLDGLRDLQRPGKPVQVGEDVRNRVVHLACQRSEGGTPRYSQHEIAKKCGISQSWVSEILRHHELTPHKTEYWCGKSPDPEFEPKMIEIVGLYLNPPQNALVLSIDEKTQIQALDRTQPELPMRPGNPRRLTNTYKRHGTVHLMAALAVETGEVTARRVERNDSESFLAFLKHLDRKYRNVDLHLVMDNLATHKSKTVRDWLAKKRKFHVHFTPTYASWLNQIEIWFSILSRDVLKDSVWHSREELIRELMRYIKEYNETKAKPFSWKYGKQYFTN